MSPIETAINSVGKVIGSFRPSAMPTLSRALYRRELQAWTFLAMMMGAVEGAVVGVVVNIAFDGAVNPVALGYAVATLAASNAFANISSFLWASASHGRHKIRSIVAILLGAALCVGMMAFAPLNEFGLIMIVLGVVGARVCWAGVATLRSTVWRVNYPDTDRARVMGKFVIAQSITMAIIGITLASAFQTAGIVTLRIAYPFAALCGVLGVLTYRGMRVRGHRVLVRAEQEQHATERPSFNPMSVWRVLRNDPAYRRFMLCQFTFGFGNIMVMAPLILMLKDRFGMEYLGGILLTSTIPLIFMTATLPLWARFMDRVHIVQFRAIHSWAFIGIEASVLLAGLTLFTPLLVFAAVLRGIAFGGGALAWNLGHHDYATPHQASQYMGVHVTLTGVRGLIAPFIGVAIYTFLESRSGGAGAWVFALCLAISLTGAIGFVKMAAAQRQRASHPLDDPVADPTVDLGTLRPTPFGVPIDQGQIPTPEESGERASVHST